MASDGSGDHLANFTDSLNKARAMVYPPPEKASRLDEILASLAETVEREHRRLLARKSIIERRKQLEEESRRLMQQKITEEAVEKRLATESEFMNKQRLLKEIAEKEFEETKQLLQEYVNRMKKRREDKENKLTKLCKALDHLERAKREESAPLVEAAYQQRLEEERVLHEREQQLEIELSRQCHDGDVKEKNRLVKMLDNKTIFQEKIMHRRQKDHVD